MKAPGQHPMDTPPVVDWSKLQKQMEDGSERLGNLGWTLPITFTLQQVARLAQSSDTDQKIERYMFDYFTSENGRFYSCLRSHILQADDLSPWRALLGQCFDAYDRGHYLIPIPSSLSVIEGTVAGRLAKHGTDVTGYAAMLKKRAQRGSVESWVWRSAKIVLSRLFQTCPFDKAHPLQLNRHWILHGRDQTQWTQMDALRLFNLLGSIS